MQDAQDCYDLTFDPISCDIGCSRDNKFAGPLNPPWPADLGRFDQEFDMGFNSIVDPDGGARVVGFEIIEDSLAVIHREQGPLDSHESANDLLACGCPASGEMLFDAFMSDGRTWVRECFSHFSAKPLIVRRTARSDRKG